MHYKNFVLRYLCDTCCLSPLCFVKHPSTSRYLALSHVIANVIVLSLETIQGRLLFSKSCDYDTAASLGYLYRGICWVLDALVPRTTSSVLKLHAVNHCSGLPAVFRGKNGQVTLENLRNIGTQQILPPCSHSLDKSTYETKVAAPVAATFGGRLMHGRQTGAEIGHGELAHVADDLAMRKMQTGLSLTGQRGVGDH